MPKKSTPARGTAQRNKPKVQKNFELVRDPSDGEIQDSEALLTAGPVPEAAPKASSLEKPASDVSSESAVATTPKVSASARLAARRQTQQKQQRTAAALITTEHYAYVRRDLIYIAILACIMLGIIIALYFILGVNS